ncbi:MAG: leucyl aminopeptidase, partial [Syntrophales bacterium]|nr:leucyl aminopeptidase [Syntrophales bacterium]
MKISIKKQSPQKHKTEAILIGHYEGQSSLEGAAGELDKAGSGMLSALIAAGDFSGKLNETALIYTRGLLPSKRILLIGLGKRDQITPEKFRNAYAAAARRMRDAKVRKFSLALDSGKYGVGMERSASAAVEGMILGLYRYTPFKTKNDEPSQIEAITLIDENSGNLKLLKEAARESEIICGAVYLARDLVSAPSNEMTPAILAREALRLKETNSLSVKIIEAPAMKRIGMNALLGVARGSCNPPKLIVMEYRGGEKQAPPVVLVGKGITFDSGGISIKPSENMNRMKDDMAGGAAVIGALKASAELGLPVNGIGLVPAAENLPDGCAYKPGDILRSLSGQTSGIISTDAEGRLILADVLTYTKRFKPAAVIDMATLTGACIIALGDFLTGMFVNDEALKERLIKAS